jgi:hypothetical protein
VLLLASSVALLTAELACDVMLLRTEDSEERAGPVAVASSDDSEAIRLPSLEVMELTLDEADSVMEEMTDCREEVAEAADEVSVMLVAPLPPVAVEVRREVITVWAEARPAKAVMMAA